MSTNTLPTKEGIDNTQTRHAYLGRDREEFHHHLDRSREYVIRFDDAGDVERVTDLDGRSAIAYRVWVEDQIGWTTRDTMLVVDLVDMMEGL